MWKRVISNVFHDFSCRSEGGHMLLSYHGPFPVLSISQLQKSRLHSRPERSPPITVQRSSRPNETAYHRAEAHHYTGRKTLWLIARSHGRDHSLRIHVLHVPVTLIIWAGYTETSVCPLSQHRCTLVWAPQELRNNIAKLSKCVEIHPHIIWQSQRDPTILYLNWENNIVAFRRL